MKRTRCESPGGGGPGRRPVVGGCDHYRQVRRPVLAGAVQQHRPPRGASAPSPRRCRTATSSTRPSITTSSKPGTDRLTAAGMDQLDVLVRRRPVPDPRIFLADRPGLGVRPEQSRTPTSTARRRSEQPAGRRRSRSTWRPDRRPADGVRGRRPRPDAGRRGTPIRPTASIRLNHNSTTGTSSGGASATTASSTGASGGGGAGRRRRWRRSHRQRLAPAPAGGQPAQTPAVTTGSRRPAACGSAPTLSRERLRSSRCPGECYGCEPATPEQPPGLAPMTALVSPSALRALADRRHPGLRRRADRSGRPRLRSEPRAAGSRQSKSERHCFAACSLLPAACCRRPRRRVQLARVRQVLAAAGRQPVRRARHRLARGRRGRPASSLSKGK